MSRMIMKNGDVVQLETYDWRAYRTAVQRSVAIHELQEKVYACKGAYPTQKVIFCFNTQFGLLPDDVKQALEPLGVEVQTWP